MLLSLRHLAANKLPEVEDPVLWRICKTNQQRTFLLSFFTVHYGFSQFQSHLVNSNLVLFYLALIAQQATALFVFALSSFIPNLFLNYINVHVVCLKFQLALVHLIIIIVKNMKIIKSVHSTPPLYHIQQQQENNSFRHYEPAAGGAFFCLFVYLLFCSFFRGQSEFKTA